MKKKIIIMAAALGVSIAAVGCGSQASTATTTTTTTEAATTTTTEAATTATEATTTAATTTASTTTAAATGGITEADAKDVALKAAGFTEADVTFTKVSQDLDDGIRKYEIDFVKDGKEYSYDINMETGAIISQEIENVND